MSPRVQAPPRNDAAQLPIVLQAREVSGRPDQQTVAEGDAELRRGGMVMRADKLSYDEPADTAVARGHVRINRDGNVYTGSELHLRLQRFEGYFLEPTYFFSRTGAGGSAQRIDFIDDQRAVAIGATYTSCPADGSGDPDWLLSTRRVKLDFAANEGVAEGAVLRFMGVPILAAPVLTFPLTDARKSGWLPPNINIDSRGGFQLAVPYYWNIAENRDATFTPGISTKRGAALGSEFRYLEPRYRGSANIDLLPHDALAGRSRHAFSLEHHQALASDTRLDLRVLQVSDDDYWKDFRRQIPSLTPRLLLSDLNLVQPIAGWTTYARAMHWQVLQDPESLIDTAQPTESSPLSLVTRLYERLPQVGARTLRHAAGFEFGIEGEINRFVKPADVDDPSRPDGTRIHLLTTVSRPWVTPGWTLTPKLSINAASYSLQQPLTDGRSHVSRAIPTFSLDSAWVLERDVRWFGRDARQTLEPRLLYVNTPFRDQSGLPNFDSASKDFNFESIYTDNAFSGIDRVSDAHQLTAGVTTRLLNPGTGAEEARLGVVQRYLFREQRITAEGEPLGQRFSDVLLTGSSMLVPRWTFDGSVEYNPDIRRVMRTIYSMRYSPGPFRTVNLTYRLARSLSEQMELGWQWPLRGTGPESAPLAPSRAKSCGGNLYGVGRINYSMRDSRITDSIIGFEYDAGCWIGRVVAERLSTGRSEATTRLLLQLELVGLSRLGSNPLGVLKDNIPGYRLLRDSQTAPATTSFYD
jgi:LPS-assembly protein